MYAGRGYVTMTYSVRGHGNSSGLSTIMSTRERQDLKRVLAFLRRFPGVNPAAVGIVGGSQGGLHGLWAAADRMPVKGITTDVIVPAWASDMLQNGSIRRTFCLLLSTAGVRYDTTRELYWKLLREDAYDSLNVLFPQNRDVSAKRLNGSHIPMLRFLKWQDHYFGAANGIATFSRYQGPKMLYIGTGGHFSDRSISESQVQSDLVTRWLGRFLRKDTMEAAYPVIQFAYSSLPMDSTGNFLWRQANTASWPPRGVHPLRLYLGSHSALHTDAEGSQSDSLTLRNRYLKPWYTFDTAFVEGFRGPRFDAAFPRSKLSFVSTELDTDIFWIGTPQMQITVLPDATTFPLHAQVYEVDREGHKYFINRINFTARHWEEGKKGVLRASGNVHAHRFQRGNRIRVDLTNIDVTNRNQLGTFPFVLPIFESSNVKIYVGGGQTSYIELPVTLDLPSGGLTSATAASRPVQGR